MRLNTAAVHSNSRQGVDQKFRKGGTLCPRSLAYWKLSIKDRTHSSNYIIFRQNHNLRTLYAKHEKLYKDKI